MKLTGKNRIEGVAFALFLILIFSLGLMKPSLDSPLATLTPTDLLFPLVLCLWLLATATGATKIKWHPAFASIGFYFIALLLSAFFSIAPSLSFKKLFGEAYLIALAVVAFHLISNVRRLRAVCLAWIAGSILPLCVALFTVLLFYSSPDSLQLKDVTHHYGAVPVGNYPRVSSTFITPSMFCNYLTVTLVITLVSGYMKWIPRLVAVSGAVLIAICAWFTISIALGGVFLCAALWIFVLDPAKRTGRFALLVGCAAALAFLIVAPFNLLPQAMPFTIELPVLGTFSPSSRLLVWGSSMRTFLADPLTGNGVGTPVANVLYHNLDGTWSLLTDAHNTFLNVAGQAGLPGLVGLIAVIASIVRAGLRDRDPNSETYYIRAGLMIAFISAFIYEGLTGSFENARHLWLLVGMILAVDRISAKT